MSSSSSPSSHPPSHPHRPLICFNCQTPGHHIRDCPQPLKNKNPHHQNQNPNPKNTNPQDAQRPQYKRPRDQQQSDQSHSAAPSSSSLSATSSPSLSLSSSSYLSRLRTLLIHIGDRSQLTIQQSIRLLSSSIYNDIINTGNNKIIPNYSSYVDTFMALFVSLPHKIFCYTTMIGVMYSLYLKDQKDESKNTNKKFHLPSFPSFLSSLLTAIKTKLSLSITSHTTEDSRLLVRTIIGLHFVNIISADNMYHILHHVCSMVLPSPSSSPSPSPLHYTQVDHHVYSLILHVFYLFPTYSHHSSLLSLANKLIKYIDEVRNPNFLCNPLCSIYYDNNYKKSMISSMSSSSLPNRYDLLHNMTIALQHLLTLSSPSSFPHTVIKYYHVDFEEIKGNIEWSETDFSGIVLPSPSFFVSPPLRHDLRIFDIIYKGEEELSRSFPLVSPHENDNSPRSDDGIEEKLKEKEWTHRHFCQYEDGNHTRSHPNDNIPMSDTNIPDKDNDKSSSSPSPSVSSDSQMKLLRHDHLTAIDRIILSSWMNDIIIAYEPLPKEGAKELLSIILPNTNNSVYTDGNNEGSGSDATSSTHPSSSSLSPSLPSEVDFTPILMELLFSLLFAFPRPHHPFLYYSTILIHFSKTLPFVFQPLLGLSIHHFFHSLPSLSIEIRDRFAIWFSFHVANFNFIWPWGNWTKVSEIEEEGEYQVEGREDSVSPFFPPPSPSRLPYRQWLTFVFDKLSRLTYWDRLFFSIPEELIALLPHEPKGAFHFENKRNIHDDHANLYYTLAQECLGRIQSAYGSSSSNITLNGDLSVFLESEIESKLNKEAKIRILIPCLCESGKESFSHLFQLSLVIFKPLLSQLSHSFTPLSYHLIISNVVEYWQHSPHHIIVILTRWQREGILREVEILEWIFAQGKKLHEHWIWELAEHVVENAVEDIMAIGMKGGNNVTVEVTKKKMSLFLCLCQCFNTLLSLYSSSLPHLILLLLHRFQHFMRLFCADMDSVRTFIGTQLKKQKADKRILQIVQQAEKW